MAKIYFSKYNDEEVAYTLDYWKTYMEENLIEEMTLFEGKRMTGEGYFYCKEYFEVGLARESCGKICEGYKPNNGKNGRCKHYGYCYEPTDKRLVLQAGGKIILS